MVKLRFSDLFSFHFRSVTTVCVSFLVRARWSFIGHGWWGFCGSWCFLYDQAESSRVPLLMRRNRCWLFNVCSFLRPNGWMSVGSSRSASRFFLWVGLLDRLCGGALSMVESTFLGLSSGFVWLCFSKNSRGSQWRMGLSGLEFRPSLC